MIEIALYVFDKLFPVVTKKVMKIWYIKKNQIFRRIGNKITEQ